MMVSVSILLDQASSAIFIKDSLLYLYEEIMPFSVKERICAPG